MKFYVIKHPDKQYSIQDKPQGAGVLLNIQVNNEKEAQLACDAANEAIKLLELLEFLD